MRSYLALGALASAAHVAARPLSWDSFFSGSWSNSAGNGDSSSSSDNKRPDAVESSNNNAADDANVESVSYYTGNTSAPNHFIYSIAPSGAPPDPAELEGYTHFAMTFWATTGSILNALAWEGLSKEDQAKTHEAYHDAGILLLISAFGSSEVPVTKGEDPTDTAKQLADWVKSNNVDGCDIDFEDFDSMRAGTAVEWLKTFQTALRQELGDGYVITHTPIAPWFTTDPQYFSGGYLDIMKSPAGETIDLLLVQFYNQDQYYAGCDQIVGSAQAYWPDTSLTQIIKSGIPANKLLIGKPATTESAASGYTDLATLAQCVEQAKGSGWNGGTMVWAYPQATEAKFVQTVWGSA